MAQFNISGSEDWEFSEIGEKLCSNFEKDNLRKKQRKLKNKKKRDSAAQNNAINSKNDKKSKVLSGSKVIIKKAKKKLKSEQYSGEKIPLINSPNSSSKQKDGTDRKGVKRKRTPTFDEHSKKTKTEFSTIDSEVSKKRKQTTIKNGTKALKKLITKTKPEKNEGIDPERLKKNKKQLKELRNALLEKEKKTKSGSQGKELPTLRQRMMSKLKAARFRFLNEQIYTTTGKETEKIFRSDPEAFKAYHEGYKLQVKKWPLNPVDKIIKSINKMNKSHVVADFGCGEASLAKSVQQTVHSFDLVAVNEMVTPCDMAHVPLQDSSVDVAVFCLSLMGTNLKDYLLEANRVLKTGGLLKIAEVESRFEDVNSFIKNCEQFGFKKTWIDLSHNLFYFIDFKKEHSIKDKKKLPAIALQPCLYKKR